MRPTVRFFIYGSCVTRDSVEFWPERGYELAHYVARHSVISAMSPANADHFNTEQVPAGFRRRMVDWDIRSSLLPLLSDNRSTYDWILWDLTDERLGVVDVPSGGVVTGAAVVTGSAYRGPKKLPRPIRMLDDGYLFRWRAAASQFVNWLAEHDLADRVIVNATPWAPAEGVDDATPLKHNARFEEFYEHLAALGLRIARPDPARVVSRPDHKWGPAPFHYVDATYHASLESIDEFVR